MNTSFRRTTEVKLTVPVSYVLHENKNSDTLVVLLHGYRQNAHQILQMVFGKNLPPYNILVPNAPFPVPIKEGQEFKEAYAWYFFNPKSEIALVGPGASMSYINQLISNHGFANHRMIILGFSQGGFFAPHVARSFMGQVEKIIGVGCSYREKSYQGFSVSEVHAIHGAKDEIVPIAMARSEYLGLRRTQDGGEFHELPHLGHDIDDSGRRLIKKLLEKSS